MKFKNIVEVDPCGLGPQRTGRPTRCICCTTATNWVEAVMLKLSVVVLIGVCDKHAPQNDAEALALVRALLHGIANAGRDIDLKARPGGGDGHG